jgi:hypothetical protein
VGVVFDGTWESWELTPGWQAEGQEIGWGEMLAIELGLRLAIARSYSSIHFIVKSDNTGVIGSLATMQAFNLEQNRVLQRIVALMHAHNIWITSEYIPSAKNLADCPSRGLPATERPHSTTAVDLPLSVSQFVSLRHISSS